MKKAYKNASFVGVIVILILVGFYFSGVGFSFIGQSTPTGAGRQSNIPYSFIGPGCTPEPGYDFCNGATYSYGPATATATIQLSNIKDSRGTQSGSYATDELYANYKCTGSKAYVYRGVADWSVVSCGDNGCNGVEIPASGKYPLAKLFDVNPQKAVFVCWTRADVSGYWSWTWTGYGWTGATFPITVVEGYKFCTADKCMGSTFMQCVGAQLVDKGSITGKCGVECDKGAVKCDGLAYSSCSVTYSQGTGEVRKWTVSEPTIGKCGVECLSTDAEKCDGIKPVSCIANKWSTGVETVGKCGVDCLGAEKKCDGFNYYQCADNKWTSTGAVVGQCNVECTEDSICGFAKKCSVESKCVDDNTPYYIGGVVAVLLIAGIAYYLKR